MTNLEKLTAGEVAARNNGTLEQLREVIEHCFQRHKTIIHGTSKYYYLASWWDKLNWDCNDTTDLPTIDITQLWEGLQALKKPEIWWIRVTEENMAKLRFWAPQLCFNVGNICGITRNPKGELYQSFTTGEPKGVSWDFGNEIDFATFLKYTGVEVEPKPTNSGELKPEIVLPEKVEKSLEEKIEAIYELKDERVDLMIKRTTLDAEITAIDAKLTEINTQISALLK